MCFGRFYTYSQHWAPNSGIGRFLTLNPKDFTKEENNGFWTFAVWSHPRNQSHNFGCFKYYTEKNKFFKCFETLCPLYILGAQEHIFSCLVVIPQRWLNIHVGSCVLDTYTTVQYIIWSYFSLISTKITVLVLCGACTFQKLMCLACRLKIHCRN